MKLIVLDFVRRWWWVLVCVLLFALLTASVGKLIFIAPAALICLLFDTQRGWLRVVRPLPVPVRGQAQSVLFIGVWLLPLLMLMILPLGVLLHGVWFEIHHTTPWFASVVGWWVGLGNSAFVFLLCVALPTGLPATRWESVKLWLVSAGWGIAMPGSMFLAMFLPTSPKDMQPWHGWLFASVPVWVWLSYSAAPELARRRLATNFTRSTAPPKPEREDTGGLTGLSLLIKDQVVRYLSILGIIMLAQWGVFHWMMGEVKFHMLAMQLPMMGVMFAALSVEALNLRLLRTLPMSTRHLTAVLMVVPLALGVFVGLGMAVAQMSHLTSNVKFLSTHNPQMSAGVVFLSYALSTAGFGALAQVVGLHWNSNKRFLTLIPLLIMQNVTAFLGGQWLPWFIPVGLGMLLLAVWLMHRGLRKSAAFYQPRQMMNGMLGQPFGQR